MSDAKKELQALRKRIAALEKEVDEAKLQEIAWESMVEVAEEMGYPIKKPWDEAMEEAKKKLAEREEKGGELMGEARFARRFNDLAI